MPPGTAESKNPVGATGPARPEGRHGGRPLLLPGCRSREILSRGRNGGDKTERPPQEDRRPPSSSSLGESDAILRQTWAPFWPFFSLSSAAASATGGSFWPLSSASFWRRRSSPAPPSIM